MTKQIWKHIVFTCAIPLALCVVSIGAGKASAQELAKPVVEQERVARMPLPIEIKQPTAVELESWRKTIIHTPRPKRACYTATYPETAWTETPCVTPPHKLYPPRRRGGGSSLVQVGDGPDFDATVTGSISEAEGQFDSIPGVTSEYTVPCPLNAAGTLYVCPTNPTFNLATENQFSLQLNTNPLNTNQTSSTSACYGATNSPCQEWEQFVYESGGNGFTQYWLINYGSSCPAPAATATQCGGGSLSTGWCSYGSDCVINAAQGVYPGSATITQLPTLKVEGSVTGVDDELTVTVGPTVKSAPGSSYFHDLNTIWKEAEFNVFGDGGADQAVFNAGSTIEVRTSVGSGVTTGPGCDSESFTGESNNLTLIDTTSNPAKGNLPSLVFTESNVLPLPSPPVGCTAAISLGDTHIHPFNAGMAGEYDFQAYGDFVLAQAGPDFEVQTRQVPGPAAYPNTATNTAVAVQMGTTRIAVYLNPERLVINGATSNLANGKSIVLPTGVQVTRRGVDEYFILDESGNRVDALLVYNGSQPLWMNVTVGLGRSPNEQVRGLLGNPRGNLNEITTAKGVVLKEPVAFADLYGSYADGWRVDPAKSLFVEEPRVKVGIPTKPFFASNLSRAAAAHATAACKAAGVTNQALLDDCVLDTTVLKNDAAIKVFTKIAPPRAVIKPVMIRKLE